MVEWVQIQFVYGKAYKKTKITEIIKLKYRVGGRMKQVRKQNPCRRGSTVKLGRRISFMVKIESERPLHLKSCQRLHLGSSEKGGLWLVQLEMWAESSHKRLTWGATSRSAVSDYFRGKNRWLRLTGREMKTNGTRTRDRVDVTQAGIDFT